MKKILFILFSVISFGAYTQIDINQNTINQIKHIAHNSADSVAINLEKSDVGLSNVDNTSDSDKPISAATQTELDLKQDKTSITTQSIVAGDVNTSQKIRITDQTVTSDIDVDDLFSEIPTKDGSGKVILPISTTQLVNANTDVILDNLKVRVVSTGGNGFQLSTVNGTITANISGYNVYGTGGGTWFANQSLGATITTTPANILGWAGEVEGNILKIFVRDTVNNKFYEISISIGASFNNNIIEIRRIL